MTVKCNLAKVSNEPSVELCLQYKFKSSPNTDEVTLLHVVGADGFVPSVTDLIGDQFKECPLSLIEPILKKYS